MSRKNIFEKIKDNYNINIEIEKIYDNLKNYDFFYQYGYDNITGQEKVIESYCFLKFCDLGIIKFFPEKSTCRDIDEFMRYADAKLVFGKNNNLTEERIINFIEVIENALFIYFKKYHYFKRRYGADYYPAIYKETRFLIDELERRIGISKIIYSDRIILYTDNPKLSQALKNVSKPELSLELIKFKKEAKTSVDKRKILKQLDILTEPITDKIKKKYRPADDLDCIFNNFQLRHNNIDIDSNDYIEKVSNLNEQEFCQIYDIAYELILDTLMLDDYDKNIASQVINFKTYLK